MNRPRPKMLPATLIAAFASMGGLLNSGQPLNLPHLGGTGTPGIPNRVRPTPSKYKPHQGAAECARRRNQRGEI